MSTIDECVSLTRSMTWEERDALLTKAVDALERGDKDTANNLVKQLPLLPGLAKVAYEWRGREYCEKHFNLFDANEEFGGGWMNG